MRTNKNRWDFIESMRLDVNHVYDIEGELEHIEISSGELQNAHILYTGTNL